MSGESHENLAFTIVGGAVVLVATGVAWTVGNIFKGIANIVKDTKRGNDIRHGRQNHSSTTQTQQKKFQDASNKRQARYETQVNSLKTGQKKMLHQMNTRLTDQKRNYEKVLRDSSKAQKAYLDKRCKHMEKDLKLAEEKFDDKLINLKQNVESRFDIEKGRVDQEFKKQKSAFSNALEQQGKELQSQISSMQSHIENSKDASAEWIEILENEISFIKSNYRHEFFCPGELSSIEERFLLSKQNMANGIFEVSLTQEAFIKANSLRNKLEMMQMEWEHARILALENLNTAVMVLEEYKSFDLSSLSVEKDEEVRNIEDAYAVETDFWTEGRWSEDYNAVSQKRDSIQTSDASVSLEELKAFTEAANDGITSSVTLAAEAKYAVIASILRADLQRDFSEKLKESGYEIVDNAVLDGDDRKANHLVLKGVNGEDISIILSPQKGGGKLSNTMELNFRDKNCNEAERKEKLDAFREVLSEIYEIPKETLNYQCKPGTDWSTNAPKEKFNLEKVRKGYAESTTS